MVSLEPGRSFVIADIPGVIEGAAEGAGLGLQFLKHLQRTLLLLHVVDLAPLDGADPVAQVRALESELARFDADLAARPRWLVLSKADLLPEGEAQARAEEIVRALDWQAPWFLISAVSGLGLSALTGHIMHSIEQQGVE